MSKCLCSRILGKSGLLAIHPKENSERERACASWRREGLTWQQTCSADLELGSGGVTEHHCGGAIIWSPQLREVLIPRHQRPGQDLRIPCQRHLCAPQAPTDSQQAGQSRQPPLHVGTGRVPSPHRAICQNGCRTLAGSIAAKHSVRERLAYMAAGRQVSHTLWRRHCLPYQVHDQPKIVEALVRGASGVRQRSLYLATEKLGQLVDGQLLPCCHTLGHRGVYVVVAVRNRRVLHT